MATTRLRLVVDVSSDRRQIGSTISFFIVSGFGCFGGDLPYCTLFWLLCCGTCLLIIILATLWLFSNASIGLRGRTLEGVYDVFSPPAEDHSGSPSLACIWQYQYGLSLFLAVIVWPWVVCGSPSLVSLCLRQS